MRTRVQRIAGAGVVLAVLAAAAGFPWSASLLAQEDEPDLFVEEPEVPEEELERALQLVLPQQKERARELIRKYPNTRVARVAQRLLEEYAAYDQLTTAERAAREAHIAFVREFWRLRTDELLPIYQPPAVRLYNPTDEPALFQIRLRHTVWMGPYRLRAGQEQLVYEPVEIRRISQGGVQVETLVPGQTYLFGGVVVEPTLPAPAGESGLPAEDAPILPPIAP